MTRFGRSRDDANIFCLQDITQLKVVRRKAIGERNQQNGGQGMAMAHALKYV